MSLPRFVLALPGPPREGDLVPLGADQARHLQVLRLRPGAALELLLPAGPWRADLAELRREGAVARLVRPLEEDAEPPVPLEACLPLTAQLSLWDEWLPPLVELGVTRIQPVVYARSEYDARRTAARAERWARIIQGAVEQSHRSRLPALEAPVPLEALLDWPVPQKWVAYEAAVGGNPGLRREALAFTSGPEGGIREDEFQALYRAGWQPVSLGRAILRAVTAPVALAGAVQFLLGRGSSEA